MPDKFSPSALERTIYQTVRYFDLFDQAVTAVQIWQCLLDQGELQGQAIPLRTVQANCQRSVWLQQKLDTQWGYFTLKGRQDLVRLRLQRHSLAQAKWKTVKKINRWLVYLPFVKMIALSGSLALGNTKTSSDLDLFVIVKRGHIWTARLGLLLVTQLLGRRRTHWDREAPDMVCLNHYLTDDALLIKPVIRNIYTAVLYRHLIPVSGLDYHRKFKQENSFWISREMVHPLQSVDLPSRHAIRERGLVKFMQTSLEAWLAEPLMEWVEGMVGSWQRIVIVSHTKPNQAGRIVVSDQELAFHPDTKAPQIVAEYLVK